MPAKLAFSIQPAARVIQVHLARAVETGVLRFAQLIQGKGTVISWISLQKSLVSSSFYAGVGQSHAKVSFQGMSIVYLILAGFGVVGVVQKDENKEKIYVPVWVVRSTTHTGTY